MATVAEYLTTEYTLQHDALSPEHATIEQNQRFAAYPWSSTPTSIDGYK